MDIGAVWLSDNTTFCPQSRPVQRKLLDALAQGVATYRLDEVLIKTGVPALTDILVGSEAA